MSMIEQPRDPNGPLIIEKSSIEEIAFLLRKIENIVAVLHDMLQDARVAAARRTANTDPYMIRPVNLDE